MFYRFARVSLAVFALLIVASSATNRIAMAQTADKTFTINSRTWAAGQTTHGPFNRPAGRFKEVSIQMTAPTDWQTGTAGRSIVMTIQKSADGGATWNDTASNAPDGIVSPQMGRNGAFPTILVVDITDDPQSETYRIVMDCSAPVTCGWLVTLSGQPN